MYNIRNMLKYKLILLILLIISCKSRNVETFRSDLKEKSTINIEDKLNVSTNVKVSVKDTSSCDEEEYSPIDNNKDMFVNGKKYKNVKFKKKKTKNGITTNKDENSVLNQSKIESIIDEKEEELKGKKTESKTNWWILVIIAVMGIIFTIYKKNS